MYAGKSKTCRQNLVERLLTLLKWHNNYSQDDRVIIRMHYRLVSTETLQESEQSAEFFFSYIISSYQARRATL